MYREMTISVQQFCYWEYGTILLVCLRGEIHMIQYHFLRSLRMQRQTTIVRIQLGRFRPILMRLRSESVLTAQVEKKWSEHARMWLSISPQRCQKHRWNCYKTQPRLANCDDERKLHLFAFFCVCRRIELCSRIMRVHENISNERETIL